jgi:hypothetical protein
MRCSIRRRRGRTARRCGIGCTSDSCFRRCEGTVNRRSAGMRPRCNSRYTPRRHSGRTLRGSSPRRTRLALCTRPTRATGKCRRRCGIASRSCRTLGFAFAQGCTGQRPRTRCRCPTSSLPGTCGFVFRSCRRAVTAIGLRRRRLRPSTRRTRPTCSRVGTSASRSCRSVRTGFLQACTSRRPSTSRSTNGSLRRTSPCVSRRRRRTSRGSCPWCTRPRRRGGTSRRTR